VIAAFQNFLFRVDQQIVLPNVFRTVLYPEEPLKDKTFSKFVVQSEDNQTLFIVVPLVFYDGLLVVDVDLFKIIHDLV
jgi:hypothetical protein